MKGAALFDFAIAGAQVVDQFATSVSANVVHTSIVAGVGRGSEAVGSVKDFV